MDSLCYGMGSLRAARSIQCTSPCALSAMQARSIQVHGHDQKNQSKSDKKTRIYKQRRAQLLAEVAQLKKEGEEQSKKTDKQFEKASKKIEEVAEQQKETDKKIKAVSEQIEETGKEVKEVVEGLRQVRIATENNGDQIGGLSNKFGGYTEAMARPAIRRILEERFHAHYLGPVRFKSTHEVEAVEVDAWGLSRNGTGTAYVVEIKSKFREKHIAQVCKQVERFRIHYSEIRERPVYPMLAVVDISEEGREKVWNAGIHLIEIDDGVFQYAKPPEDFEANGYHGMRGVRRDVPYLRLVPDRDQKRRGTG